LFEQEDKNGNGIEFPEGKEVTVKSLQKWLKKNS
jgi:hypothetical protein